MMTEWSQTRNHLLNAIFIKFIKYLPELLSVHVADICILLRLLQSRRHKGKNSQGKELND